LLPGRVMHPAMYCMNISNCGKRCACTIPYDNGALPDKAPISTCACHAALLPKARQKITTIVDDGSPQIPAQEIREFCAARNYQYLRLDSGHEPFSLSRARNAGLRAAKTEWVCLEDADLVYPQNHYQRLILELEQLDRTPFNFLTVPVAYLAETTSVEITEAGTVDPFLPRLTSAILLESPVPDTTNNILEHFAPATSVLALKKQTAMLVGGYDETFAGWGGEDRDFAFRLLRANDKLERPSVFGTSKPWNLNDTCVYEGWRSLYCLVGDYAAMKALYGFHLWHPHLPWRTGDKTNIQYASEKAKRLAAMPAWNPIFDRSKPSDVVLGYNPHLVNARCCPRSKIRALWQRSQAWSRQPLLTSWQRQKSGM